MKKMVCHGDSLTEAPDLDKNYSWPNLVESRLNLNVINSGIGGDTSGGLLGRFYHDVVRHQPDLVVFAECTEDVSKVLAYAHRNRVPVTTRGAGVGYVGGCVPVEGGIVLTTERMNKILSINPEDGVAIVQPGVITGHLQDAVRDVGWDYPPEGLIRQGTRMASRLNTAAAAIRKENAPTAARL